MQVTVSPTIKNEGSVVVNMPIVAKNAIEISINNLCNIEFEKVVISKKDDIKGLDLRGAITITKDDNHRGWLHVLIYIGQIFNAIIFGVKRDDMNLCHAEMNLNVIEKLNKQSGNKEKVAHRVLAHAVMGGIKTTAEDHKTDDVITHIVVYRPVDKKIRELFAAYAEQTALAKEPKDSKVQRAPFSYKRMIGSAFHSPQPRNDAALQRRTALSAADLLLKGLMKDANGEASPECCSGYLLNLVQGCSIISQLAPNEQEVLIQLNDRNAIADAIVARISGNNEGDLLKKVYTNNKFMQLNASYTMPYIAGRHLNMQSKEKTFEEAQKSWVAEA